MKILKLHHPTGHSYWQADEYKIEMPDGTFYNKRQYSNYIPSYAVDDMDYCNSHRIVVKPDGIYYQRCGASSGTGKTNYKEPFKIIDAREYDEIEYVGAPLTMSDELQNEVSAMTTGDEMTYEKFIRGGKAI